MATRCLLHPAGKDICAESTHAQLRCVSRAQVPKLESKIEALGKKKCKIRKPGSSFRAQISRFSKVDKTEAELCVSHPGGELPGEFGCLQFELDVSLETITLLVNLPSVDLAR